MSRTHAPPVKHESSNKEQSVAEDEPIQTHANADPAETIQRATQFGMAIGQISFGPGGGFDEPAVQRKENRTGLSDSLKSGIENLSGMSLDNVRVHYNSAKPAAVQAHAYTQGTDIHVAPGQEQHVPHEAWHVVQQAQGRVQATRQLKSVALNDDPGLEREADEMGAKAISGVLQRAISPRSAVPWASSGAVVQRNATAQAAHAEVTQLKVRADGIRDEAQAPAVTAARLGELKVEVDQLLRDAEAQQGIAEAQKAPTAATYKSAIKQLMDQIRARVRVVDDALVKSNADAATIEMANMVQKFAASMSNTINVTWQTHVNTALTSLRAATTASTALEAKQYAKDASTASDALKKSRAGFDKALQSAINKLNAFEATGQKHYLSKGEAEKQARDYRALAGIVGDTLAVQVADAENAAAAADAIANAFTQSEATAANATAAQDNATRLVAAVNAAKSVWDTAQVHANQMEVDAQAAEQLAIAAQQVAQQAQAQAQAAHDASEQSSQKAARLTGAIPTYSRHLAYAPTADAVRMFEQRKLEAANAETDAHTDRTTRDQQAAVATTRRQESDNARSSADTKHQEAQTARTKETQSGAEHTRLDQERATADTDAQKAAQDAAAAQIQKNTAIAQGNQHTTLMDQLAAGEPDAQARIKVRRLYGDAAANALLTRGVKATLLDKCFAEVQPVLLRWPVEAPNIVFDTQTKFADDAKKCSDYLETALAVAPSAARMQDLLHCINVNEEWFLDNAIPTANKRLTAGWSTAEVASVLKAAYNDAKLHRTQLESVEGVIARENVTAVNAETLLKAGVTATFLVNNALTSVEKLFHDHWDTANIVALVKAAGDLSKPTQTQFEQFCTLVDNNAVTAANAVAIMKGANCTADYLNNTAFITLRDAVVAGWTTQEIKDFIDPAETKAQLTQVQLVRFYALLVANNFQRAHAVLCLSSVGVADWTYLMNRVDDFVADGNTGAPAGVPGGLAQTVSFEHPPGSGNHINIQIQQARIQHFAMGHTYRHYQLTSANIYRGDGNQPSSMWARGTTAAHVRNTAAAAAGTAGVQGQVIAIRAAAGLADPNPFDQVDYPTYTVGVQWYAPSATLMQFFPLGANAAATVPPNTMAAIARLFRGAI